MKITTLLLAVVLFRTIEIGSGTESVDPEWYDSFEMKNYNKAFSVIYAMEIKELYEMNRISGKAGAEPLTYHEFVYLGKRFYYRLIEKPIIKNDGSYILKSNVASNYQCGFDGETYWVIQGSVLSTVDARKFPESFDLMLLNGSYFNKNIQVPDNITKNELELLRHMAVRMSGNALISNKGISRMPLCAIHWDRVTGTFHGTTDQGFELKVEILKTDNRIPIKLSSQSISGTNTYNFFVDLKYNNPSVCKYLPSFIQLYNADGSISGMRELNIYAASLMKNPEKTFSYYDHLFPGIIKVAEDSNGIVDRVDFDPIRDTKVFFAGHWIDRQVISYLFWGLIAVVTASFTIKIWWSNLPITTKTVKQ